MFSEQIIEITVHDSAHLPATLLVLLQCKHCLECEIIAKTQLTLPQCWAAWNFCSL